MAVARDGMCALFKGGCKDEGTRGCCDDTDPKFKGPVLTFGKGNNNTKGSELLDIAPAGVKWVSCMGGSG